MATENILASVTLEAAADLSAKQYTFVTVDGSGQAAAATAAGEPVFGVLQNDPDAAGEAATVAVAGISKVFANATIDEGDLIKTSADGQADVATKASTDTTDTAAAADPLVGSYVIGIATSAGAAGEIVSVLLTHAGAVATTDA